MPRPQEGPAPASTIVVCSPLAAAIAQIRLAIGRHVRVTRTAPAGADGSSAAPVGTVAAPPEAVTGVLANVSADVVVLMEDSEPADRTYPSCLDAPDSQSASLSCLQSPGVLSASAATRCHPLSPLIPEGWVTAAEPRGGAPSSSCCCAGGGEVRLLTLPIVALAAITVLDDANAVPVAADPTSAVPGRRRTEATSVLEVSHGEDASSLWEMTFPLPNEPTVDDYYTANVVPGLAAATVGTSTATRCHPGDLRGGCLAASGCSTVLVAPGVGCAAAPTAASDTQDEWKRAPWPCPDCSGGSGGERPLLGAASLVAEVVMRCVLLDAAAGDVNAIPAAAARLLTCSALSAARAEAVAEGPSAALPGRLASLMLPGAGHIALCRLLARRPPLAHALRRHAASVASLDPEAAAAVIDAARVWWVSAAADAAVEDPLEWRRAAASEAQALLWRLENSYRASLVMVGVGIAFSMAGYLIAYLLTLFGRVPPTFGIRVMAFSCLPGLLVSLLELGSVIWMGLTPSALRRLARAPRLSLCVAVVSSAAHFGVLALVGALMVASQTPESVAVDWEAALRTPTESVWIFSFQRVHQCCGLANACLPMLSDDGGASDGSLVPDHPPTCQAAVAAALQVARTYFGCSAAMGLISCLTRILVVVRHFILWRTT